MSVYFYLFFNCFLLFVPSNYKSHNTQIVQTLILLKYKSSIVWNFIYFILFDDSRLYFHPSNVLSPLGVVYLNQFRRVTAIKKIKIFFTERQVCMLIYLVYYVMKVIQCLVVFVFPKQ